jgi:hypothetical protein
VHVFVNPEVFDRLQPTGAQVVLSHEAVHVATDAARSDVAPWLLEGSPTTSPSATSTCR